MRKAKKLLRNETASLLHPRGGEAFIANVRDCAVTDSDLFPAPLGVNR